MYHKRTLQIQFGELSIQSNEVMKWEQIYIVVKGGSILQKSSVRQIQNDNKIIQINESCYLDVNLPFQDYDIIQIKLRGKGLVRDYTICKCEILLRYLRLPIRDIFTLHDKQLIILSRLNLTIQCINTNINTLIPNPEVNNTFQIVSDINLALENNNNNNNTFNSLFIHGFALYVQKFVQQLFPDIQLTLQQEQKPQKPLETLRSKFYIFGDDKEPQIMEFDFSSEKFTKKEVPYNLSLFGYSMAQGLPNGKIIITGGINKQLNIIVNTTFWYDPITNTAKLLKEMYQSRYTHTITYLNGYIYCIGGRYYGKEKEGVLKHCERYDLASNKWEKIADLIEKRCTSVAVAFNEYIYLFGGYHGSGRLKSIERYSIALNKWELIQLQLKIPIEAGLCFAIGEQKVIYLAGKDDKKSNGEAIEYDLMNQTFKQCESLTQGRVLPRATKYKNHIYIFGGAGQNNYTWEKCEIGKWNWVNSGNYSYINQTEMKLFSSSISEDLIDDSVLPLRNEFIFFGDPDHKVIYIFDSVSNSWKSQKPPSNFPFHYYSTAGSLPNNSCLIVGGTTKSLDRVYKHAVFYNPQQNEAKLAAPMLYAKYKTSLVYQDGFLYSIGGCSSSGKPINICERYNFRANSWESIAFMHESRIKPSVISDNINYIYAFGGFGIKGYPLTTFERYSIKEDTWYKLQSGIQEQTENIFSYYDYNTKNIIIFGNGWDYYYQFDHLNDSIQQKNPSKSDIIYKFKCALFNDNIIYYFNDSTQENSQSFSTLWKNGGVQDKQGIDIKDIPSSIIKNGVATSIISKLPYLGYCDTLSFGIDNECESRAYFFSYDSRERIFYFDFKTENFEEVQKPENLRFYNQTQATSLSDGKILLCGGLNFRNLVAEVVNTSYLYSPYSNTAIEINSMSIPRYGHSLVTYKDSVYAIGGKRNFTQAKENVICECERYDIFENVWRQINPLNTERTDAGCVIIGKYIYIFGGNDGQSQVNTIERYSLETYDWQVITQIKLHQNIEKLSCISIAYNEILIFGGKNNQQTFNDVISFNQLKTSLTNKSPMLYNRNGHKVAQYANNLYVFGGSNSFTCEKTQLTEKEYEWKSISSYEHLVNNDLRNAGFAVSKINFDSHGIYDLSEKRNNFNKLYIFGTENTKKIIRLNLDTLIWEEIQKPENLNLWDYSIASTLPNGKIFLSGGINAQLTSIKNSSYLLDFSQTPYQCEVLPSMIQPRYTHTVCYSNKYIYVMGGRYYGNGINGVLNHCERYNLKDKVWEALAPMNSKRCTAMATTYMNKIYIFGGYRGDGRVKSIERYNEILNYWETVPLLLTFPIEANTMVPISSKELVLIGGKDDFSEQAYVTLYNLERCTSKNEKSMIHPRILSKSAKYKGQIFVIGGHSSYSCEKAEIGLWEWTTFNSYKELINDTLAKAAHAQSL